MVNLKLFSNKEEVQDIILYLKSVLDSFETPLLASEISVEEDKYVCIRFSFKEHAENLLLVILEDYGTLGLLDAVDLPIMNMTVYVDDPIMMAWYTQQRINISDTTSAALFDLMDSIGTKLDQTNSRISYLDAFNTVNGLSNFKDVMYSVCKQLDNGSELFGDLFDSTATIH